MADPRFFRRAGPFRLQEIAGFCDAELAGRFDPDMMFDDVGSLNSAGPSQVSFLDNPKYLKYLGSSKAGACIIKPELAERAPEEMALLLSSDPYRAYARTARAFYPDDRSVPGIHESAVVEDSAAVGEDVCIAAGVAIGPHAELGARCRIGANTVIDAGVVIGEDTVIGPNVTLSHCLIGARVVVFPGVRIGQPGFGYAMGPSGHLHVPQLGRVIVEDDVHIGANTTIDRGAGPDTVIGRGSIVDNLVQVAHNVKMGQGCVLAAQVGIAGSTELGDFVVAGGQVGIAGHVNIGSGAQMSGQSGVVKNLAPGERVMGRPARPMMQYLRELATLSRLTRKQTRPK
jgi:UDP-3-O-[3-hydroxymyristoyl] glucosamine N-acyltransferase